MCVCLFASQFVRLSLKAKEAQAEERKAEACNHFRCPSKIVNDASNLQALERASMWREECFS